MFEFLLNISIYEWFAFGIFLLILEVALTGSGHLLWGGIAALVTGVLAAVGAHWTLQWLAFGITSIGGAILWIRHQRLKKEAAGGDAADGLNAGGNRLIGREAVLVESIHEGRGRAKIGDTTWLVSGPDLAAGAKVRVTGQDGVVLLVSPA